MTYALTQWFSFLFLSYIIICRKEYIKSNKNEKKVEMKKRKVIGNFLSEPKSSVEYHILRSSSSSSKTFTNDEVIVDGREGEDMEDNDTDTESELNMSEGNNSPHRDEKVGLNAHFDVIENKRCNKNMSMNKNENKDNIKMTVRAEQMGDDLIIKAEKGELYDDETVEEEEDDVDDNWYVFIVQLFVSNALN